MLILLKGKDSCCCSSASLQEWSPVAPAKRRNSQFGVFFGHGSVGEHETPVGTEKSAVSYRGDGAAARRPPARAKGKRFAKHARGYFTQTTTPQGGQEEIAGDSLQKARQRGALKTTPDAEIRSAFPRVAKSHSSLAEISISCHRQPRERGPSGDLGPGCSSRQTTKLIGLRI